jgi:hypothetical protein
VLRPTAPAAAMAATSVPPVVRPHRWRGSCPR